METSNKDSGDISFFRRGKKLPSLIAVALGKFKHYDSLHVLAGKPTKMLLALADVKPKPNLTLNISTLLAF